MARSRRLLGRLDFIRNAHGSREAATGARGNVPVALDRSFVAHPTELWLRDEDTRDGALTVSPRAAAAEPSPPPAPESPLKTFTLSLAVAGTFTRDVVGNFLRYNASVSGGGSDRVTIQLQDNENDTTHSPVSFYPGMRLKGRAFRRLTIVVPTAVAGATAEFVYTALQPGEAEPDMA
jgi:hypothetical protein